MKKKIIDYSKFEPKGGLAYDPFDEKYAGKIVLSKKEREKHKKSLGGKQK